MQTPYVITINHKDGHSSFGYAEADSASLAEGYGQWVAMKLGWEQDDITVDVEEQSSIEKASRVCYARRGKYMAWQERQRQRREWLERKRYEAAYDAANGYDLDDEGFSLHDYS